METNGNRRHKSLYALQNILKKDILMKAKTEIVGSSFIIRQSYYIIKIKYMFSFLRVKVIFSSFTISSL